MLIQMVYKKAKSDTSSDNECQQVTKSGTTKDDEWQLPVQWMTTNGKTSDKEWQRVTVNDSEWYQMRRSGLFG